MFCGLHIALTKYEYLLVSSCAHLQVWKVLLEDKVLYMHWGIESTPCGWMNSEH